jgi:hypothetical protein
MQGLYQFLGTHEVLIYILLAIGALFALRWLWASWIEWRQAVYSLEKEFALRRIGQAVASLTLLAVLFCGELITASFIIPSLPASYFVATVTPDLLATPTGTISAELATQLALTPHPAEAAASQEGCVEDHVNIVSPKAGDELRGIVEIRGSVDVPQLGFYKYEVASAGTEAWAAISAGREKVVNGSLGQWDTSALPPGDYLLRLVVTDNQGQSLPPCVIRIRIGPQA